MTEPSTAQASQSHQPAVEPGAGPPETVWQRLQRHKVLQWTLAYAAAAYTVLHATQMVVESFDWPHLIVRVVALGLVVALPIVVLLAWYHGHKAQHRFSTAELSILTVLLLIAGTVMWGFTRVRAPVAAAGVTAAVGGSGSVPSASVAVVPFTNLTGEAGKEYFSDGMAEELINELTKVPGLKVPARTSSFAYKGRNIDVRQIARDLGVATILEGSVRSAGEHIRVTAQLINAQSGYHIWSNTYNADFGDVFKLQDDISAEIVEALKRTMNAQLPAAVAQVPPTQDSEAYRLYLQAQGGSSQEAVRLLTQAIDRDPRFARAYALRALARVTEAMSQIIDPDGLSGADRDANKALSLDPRLSDAHVALGALNAWRGDWLAAESNYQGAMQLSPRDAEPLVTHSVIVLSSVGHMREGVQELLKAYALAPGSADVTLNAAAMYMLVGMDAEAAHYANLTTSLGDPANDLSRATEAWIAIRSGRYAKAADLTAESAKGQMDSPAALDTMKRAIVAIGGDRAEQSEAARSLRTLLKELRQNEPQLQHRDEEVVLSVMIGDLDLAFDTANADLDQDVRLGTVGTTWGFLWMPEMRPFRLDRRFQAFVTRLKLFDYWKQYGPPDECNLRGNVLVCR